MTHNGRNSRFKLSNEISEMIDENWRKSERQLNFLHSKSFFFQFRCQSTAGRVTAPSDVTFWARGCLRTWRVGAGECDARARKTPFRQFRDIFSHLHHKGTILWRDVLHASRVIQAFMPLTYIAWQDWHLQSNFLCYPRQPETGTWDGPSNWVLCSRPSGCGLVVEWEIEENDNNKSSLSFSFSFLILASNV